MTIHSIDGIGDISTTYESTSKKVVEEYTKWMTIIKNIFDKPESSWNTNDYNQLIEALEALKKLAKEGATSNGVTDYLTNNMAAKLQSVYALLNEFGISADKHLNPQQGLEAMKMVKKFEGVLNDGTKVTFARILSNAVSGISGQDTSLQEMLLASFLTGAYQAYENNLKTLKEQIQVNTRILELLTKIQELRNKVVKTPDGVPWNPSDKPGTVTPVVTMTDADMKDLVKYREQLGAELEALKKCGVSDTDPNSAAFALKQIVNDLDSSLNEANSKLIPPGPPSNTSTWTAAQWDSYLNNAKTGANAWFKDNLDQIGGNAGKFSDNLSKATSASLALNETQKQQFKKLDTNWAQYVDMGAQIMDMLHKMFIKLSTGIKS